WMIWQKNAYLF
nr:immunoglobulin light chain junction region [Macaca mulatta]